MKNLIKLLILSTLTAYSDADLDVIAEITEASGVSYCKNTDTLVVASDEGSLYEITTSGDIISEHELDENYDLEGVVCEDKEFIFAVEDGSLLKFNRETEETKELEIVDIYDQKFEFTKKHGIEGISKRGSYYYLSIQAKEEKDAYIVVVKIEKDYVKIIKTIHHKIIDSSGLQWHNGKLYILSDNEDELYQYDLKNRKIVKTIELPPFEQEGITFDNKDGIYFADDDGAVIKYSRDDLKL